MSVMSYCIVHSATLQFLAAALEFTHPTSLARSGALGLVVFRLDALALSVIATATWLAGWVAVCHSRYCIKTTKRI